MHEASAGLPGGIDVCTWKASLFQDEPYVDNYREFRQQRGPPISPLAAPEVLPGVPEGVDPGELPRAEMLRESLAAADHAALHPEVQSCNPSANSCVQIEVGFTCTQICKSKDARCESSLLTQGVSSYPEGLHLSWLVRSQHGGAPSCDGDTVISGEGGGTNHISWLAGSSWACLRNNPGRRNCCTAGLQGVSPMQAPIQLLCRTFWQVYFHSSCRQGTGSSGQLGLCTEKHMCCVKMMSKECSQPWMRFLRLYQGCP